LFSNEFYDGANRHGVDSTGSCAIRNANFDVTIFTPGWAPGVLDKEVFLVVFRSITNSKDTMVKVSSTLVASDDS
jgi:hypothetical protein